MADEQIKLILSALLTDPDVLAASVHDERDRLVAEAGDTTQFGDSRFHAEEDIYYDAGDQLMRIGVLRITLAETRLGAQARERLSLAVLLAGILLVAVIAATSAVNRRIIGRPLALMMDSLNRPRSAGPPILDFLKVDAIPLAPLPDGACVDQVRQRHGPAQAGDRDVGAETAGQSRTWQADERDGLGSGPNRGSARSDARRPHRRAGCPAWAHGASLVGRSAPAPARCSVPASGGSGRR